MNALEDLAAVARQDNPRLEDARAAQARHEAAMRDIRHLGVHRGEVVLEDAGWGCPAECSVGSVVIVEMHEPGVGAGPLGF